MSHHVAAGRLGYQALLRSTADGLHSVRPVVSATVADLPATCRGCGAGVWLLNLAWCDRDGFRHRCPFPTRFPRLITL